MKRMKALLLSAGWLTLVGCQYVSGLNELEVEAESPGSSETGNQTSDETSASGETSTSSDVNSTSGECSIPSGLDCGPSNNCGCDADEVCGLLEQDGDLTVGCQKPGKAKEGDLCQLGDCGSGLLCVQGICLTTCRFDDNCEHEDATCTQVQRPNGQSLSSVRYCQQNCDLVSPQDPDEGYVSCTEEQSCVATVSGSTCVNVVGDGEQRDSCEGDADCAAGFTCQGSECKQWCSVKDPQCPAGVFCESAPDASPAIPGLGVCGGGCQATVPEGDECLTEPNCGCPVGQTCRAIEDGSRACSPAGSAGLQSACESNANCASELACIGGLCRPYCDVEEGTCDAKGGDCIQVLYEDSIVEGVGACLGSCDPVHPENEEGPYSPCGDGAKCEVGYDDSIYPTSHCAVTGTSDGERTGPCAEDYSCAETATCIFDRCFPLCRRDEDCAGITDSPACIPEELGYFATEDDPIQVCCSPTPIAGSTCAAFVLECGCGDGFTCRAIGYDGHTECSEVGTAEKQERCDADTDCVAGTSCVGAPAGLCRPHCNETCEPNQGSCIQVTNDDYPIPYAQVCVGHCDPVYPSRSDLDVAPCGAEAHCVAGWQGEDDPIAKAAFCIGKEPMQPSGIVGDDCGFDNDCEIGLGCDFRGCPVDDEACLGVCVEYCYSTEDCEPGTTCNLTVGRVIDQGVPVGYCEDSAVAPPGE